MHTASETQYALILAALLEGERISDDIARHPRFHKCSRVASVACRIRVRNRDTIDLQTELVPNQNGSKHAVYYIKNLCHECKSLIPFGETLCQCKKAEVVL